MRVKSNKLPQQPPSKPSTLNNLVNSKYFLIFLSFIIIIQITNITYHIVYSQEIKENIEERVEKKQDQVQDVIAAFFNNSLANMLVSTFIIAIVGLLITKLRNFKKSVDMVQVLVKGFVKLKKEAVERDKRFEHELMEAHADMREQVDRLCKKIDELEQKIETKANSLDQKIESVKDEATNTLIDYLAEGGGNRPIGTRRKYVKKRPPVNDEEAENI